LIVERHCQQITVAEALGYRIGAFRLVNRSSRIIQAFQGEHGAHPGHPSVLDTFVDVLEQTLGALHPGLAHGPRSFGEVILGEC
jgi:hypothetical protein